MIRKKEYKRENKLFKVYLVACVLIVVLGSLISLFDDHSASNTFNKDFEIITEYSYHHKHLTEIRNKKTGAHYYIDNSGQISPVYNFNGTIKTSEAGE